MKKLILALVCLCLLISSTSVYACHKFKKTNINSQKACEKQADFEIVPTMNTVSNAKNVVWVGTFQLIWNDLIDEIVKSPVQFVNEKSTMADNLNKREFSANDLSENSYYKKLGFATFALKEEIEKAIKEKFNEKSDILDKFNWKKDSTDYILYAILKKDFQYIKPFDKLEDDVFEGSKGLVKYFGIDSDSSRSLRYTVNVLFYNSDKDFAVSLRTKQGDTVYLYRTDDDKTFDKLYDDMIHKSNFYMGLRSFGKKDEFKVPILEFKKEQEFSELCNKSIKNTDFIINKAIETIQFKMDETGVKLKSEAGMIVGATAVPSDRDKPRYFYFNKRYIIFLQEKSKPYFAMKIEDAKKLQK